MPATRRGVYHNLNESKYVASNGEATFFFSSKVYLNKFIEGYEEYRTLFNKRFNKIASGSPLNMTFLADIHFYKEVETRGFKAWLRGVNVDWHELHQFALREMTRKNIAGWQVTQKPKLDERRKTMESTYRVK